MNTNYTILDLAVLNHFDDFPGYEILRVARPTVSAFFFLALEMFAMENFVAMISNSYPILPAK